MTREAVIVSTARTGLAKSGRGGFNMTHGAAIAGHAVKHSIERANLDPAEIDDVIMGCGTPEGATGQNVGRLAAIWAGCPVTTSGVTVNRFCSSGLQTIAMAAGRVVVDLEVSLGRGHRMGAAGALKKGGKCLLCSLAQPAPVGGQAQQSRGAADRPVGDVGASRRQRVPVEQPARPAVDRLLHLRREGRNAGEYLGFYTGRGRQ
mgnify:CR=1 FL=1